MSWTRYAKKLLFPDKTNHNLGIHSEQTFRRKLERERNGVDRNGHMFSLVLIDLQNFDKSGHKKQTLLQKLAARIRMVDEIGWYDRYRVGLILRYTGVEGASRLIDEIGDLCKSEGSPLPACILHTYPLPQNAHEQGDPDNTSHGGL